MKALSVGLIKGNIDEVDQKVQMTWVQPRVLDLQQVSLRFCLIYRSRRDYGADFYQHLVVYLDLNRADIAAEENKYIMQGKIHYRRHYVFVVITGSV